MKLLSVDFWKSNTSYVASNRYKSFIVYNDTLYICNESHVSGNTFDVSKFTSIGGAGGGLSVTGDWDIASSTSLGPVTALPLAYDTYYDSTSLGDLNMIANTSSPPIYPFASNYRVFGASSPVIDQTNGMKYVTIDTTGSISYAFLLIYEDTYTDPINDLILTSLGSSNPATNYSLIPIVKVPNNNGVLLIDSFGEHEFTGLTFDANSTSVNIGIDILDGYVTVSSGNTTSSQNLNITGTNFKIGLFSIYGSFFSKEILEMVRGTPSFTYQGQELVVVPPEGAIDGNCYHFTSDGVFNGVSVKLGDYGVFFNNLLSVLPIKYYDNQIQSIGNTVDALNTFVNDNILTMVERVVARGIIDVISDNEPSAPFFGKTWVDTNNNDVLKVYDGSAWVTVTPNQFQSFVYADTGLELFYNKLMISSRKKMLTPTGESNINYYNLLNTSSKWAGEEAKSCQYINLATINDPYLYMDFTSYTDVIIDASYAALGEYTATYANGVQVYESDTSYIKEHRIQLYSSGNSCVVNFNNAINGLYSSFVQLTIGSIVNLVLTQTPNFNNITYISGVEKMLYMSSVQQFGTSPSDFWFYNIEEIFINIDEEVQLTFATVINGGWKSLKINYKNTATNPSISLLLKNNGGDDHTVAIPIVGVSGSVTILTDGVNYEVF